MSNKLKFFVKDTLLTLVSRIVSLVVGLITSILLARLLGPTGNGIYTMSTLLPGLLITFLNLGISAATIYYTARGDFSPKEILGSTVFLSLIISVLMVFLGLGLVLGLPQLIFPKVERVFLLWALLLAPLFLFRRQTLSSILLGLKQTVQYNAGNIIANFSFLIFMLIVMVGLDGGVLGLIWAFVFSETITVGFLLFWIYKASGALSLKYNSAIIRHILSYGLQAYIGNLMGFLNYRVEVFLMGILLPTEAVGFYAVATLMAEKLWLLSQSAATIIFPFISSENDEEQRKRFTPIISRNVLLITALGASILFIFSPWIIVLLYGNDYQPTIQLFRILLVGVTASSASRILANDIAGRGKPILNTYVGGIALFMQIIMNLYLIPYRGAVGSAWATTLTYVFVLVVRLWLYTRISGNVLVISLLPQRSDWVLYKKLWRIVRDWIDNKMRLFSIEKTIK